MMLDVAHNKLLFDVYTTHRLVYVSHRAGEIDINCWRTEPIRPEIELSFRLVEKARAVTEVKKEHQ